jgi:hypothetical protein
MEGPDDLRVFTFCSHLAGQSGRIPSQKAPIMSDRFPPLRSQADLSGQVSASSRALPAPSGIDLTLFAALVFVVALAIL